MPGRPTWAPASGARRNGFASWISFPCAATDIVAVSGFYYVGKITPFKICIITVSVRPDEVAKCVHFVDGRNWINILNIVWKKFSRNN